MMRQRLQFFRLQVADDDDRSLSSAGIFADHDESSSSGGMILRFELSLLSVSLINRSTSAISWGRKVIGQPGPAY